MAYISHNVSDADRRLSIASFLIRLGKFALDSAITVPLKALTGRKKLSQTFLHEKLTDESNRLKLEDVKCGSTKMEYINDVKCESTKMEYINEFKQHCKTTTDRAVGGSEPMKKKKTPQGLQEMELQDPKRKRKFIRSRL